MKQSQASLLDQLLQVRALANQNGFYDAADFLTQHIDRGPILETDLTLNQLERRGIVKALDSYAGDTVQAAASLGITTKALYIKMREYRLL